MIIVSKGSMYVAACLELTSNPKSRIPHTRVWEICGCLGGSPSLEFGASLNNILEPELGEFEFGRCPQIRVWVIWGNSLKVNV